MTVQFTLFSFLVRFMTFCTRVLRFILFSSLLGVAGLTLLACGSDEANDVEVIEPGLVKTPAGERSFTGTLVNNGSRPLSIAQVEVVLYDEAGSVVETIRIEVEKIPAQDSVEFSQRIDSDQSFSQAQVKSVLTP